MRYIVAYDISDDSQRLKVASLLAGYGVRIQQSVFDCRLEVDELEAVLQEAGTRLAPGYDRIHAFARCDRCAAGTRTLGPERTVLEEPFYII
jgi:CRISPR-associated protein Cas2